MKWDIDAAVFEAYYLNNSELGGNPLLLEVISLLITLKETKEYLRVDGDEDDSLTES